MLRRLRVTLRRLCVMLRSDAQHRVSKHEERAKRASRSIITTERAKRATFACGPSRRALRALLRVTSACAPQGDSLCHAEERAQRASRSMRSDAQHRVSKHHHNGACEARNICVRPFETRTTCAPQGDKCSVMLRSERSERLEASSQRSTRSVQHLRAALRDAHCVRSSG